MRPISPEARVYLFTFVIVALFALVSVLQVESFWGFNYLKFLPQDLTYISLMALGLVLIPAVGRFLVESLETVSEYLSARKTLRVSLLTVLTIASLPALYSLAPVTGYLGDGALRVQAIAMGKTVMATEFLDFLIHALLYNHLFEPLGYKVNQMYYAVSSLCGAAFIIGAYRLGRYLSPGHFLKPLILLGSSGMIVLFFGYIESYSIIAALLPFVFLSALKVGDGVTSGRVFFVWYVLAVLTHSVAFFLFTPVLVLTILNYGQRLGMSLKQLSRWLTVGLVVAIALAYVSRYLGMFNVNLFLMPFLLRENYEQGILTVNHFLNLCNWLFFGALPGLLIFVFFWGKSKDSDDLRLRRRTLALWTVVPVLVFIFFFTPQLGGPRDWDLFSLAIYLLIPAGLVLLNEKDWRAMRYALSPLALIALTMIGSFIYINASTGLSSDRFIEVIEVAKFKNLYKEYGLLSNHASIIPELALRHLEFAELAWKQPPYTHRDSLNNLLERGGLYLEKDRANDARRVIRTLFALDSVNLDVYSFLRRFQERYGNRDDLLRLAQAYANNFPDDPFGQMNGGVLLLRMGEEERGAALLTRAFEMDSANVTIVLNFAQYFLRKGDYSRALQLYERVEAKDPTNFSALYNQALVYLSMGDTAKAQAKLIAATPHVSSPKEKKNAEDLMPRLGLRRR